jgi:hypothetical protein
VDLVAFLAAVVAFFFVADVIFETFRVIFFAVGLVAISFSYSKK